MRIITLWYFILISTTVFADPIDTVIVPPVDNPQAGQKLEFAVYFHNPTNDIQKLDLPESVTCRLISPDQQHELPAESVEPAPKLPVEIPPNGFIKVSYTVAVPATVAGPITLSIPAFKDATSVLVVDAAPSPKTETEAEATAEADAAEYQTIDSLFNLYQPYLGNISAYQPMYFLVGIDPEKSTFQFSFKYRFLNPESRFGRKYRWLQGFHLAYTQRSFWDLKSESAPFKDTSYMPEFFYQTANLYSGTRRNRRIFLQTGFQHESNGRGGDASRSTNYLYAQPIFVFYDKETLFGVGIAPKVWAYVANDDETNPDLADYRGYFDLGLKIGKADSLLLGSNLRWARKGGSIQLDLTYPLHQILANTLEIYLQVQYVNALAESLLSYTERTKALRIGFAIVR